MFVIVQNFDELPAESRTTAIPSRISMAMRNAGVAITLTSLTDIIVFAVGASTVTKKIKVKHRNNLIRSYNQYISQGLTCAEVVLHLLRRWHLPALRSAEHRLCRSPDQGRAADR